ncbi:hypothetical protein BD289DRAFT_480703 [Coniella lustricola]|uniref:DRBM domain-containing protein n=1 Tax=Coniella lustricola TaxID=2025994 RepID=A0A2T3AER9_9PEZI|nr:hypothetical protein BD289DRAFT_480703 [Coniella lustricola]
MASSTGVTIQLGDLALVRKWIVEQEQFYAQYGRSAPLTSAQTKAISALLTAIKAPAGENYVGILQEFCQTRELNVSYTEGSVGQDWTCRATIKGSIGDNGAFQAISLPMDGYGSWNGHQPCFSSKKQAKQHAASSVMEWLVARGLMMPAHSFDTTATTSGSSTPSPAYTGPEPAIATQKETSNGAGSTKRPRGTSVEASLRGEGPSSDDDDEPTDESYDSMSGKIKQQNGIAQSEAVNKAEPQLIRSSDIVAKICNDNNIPLPRYQIDEGPASGFYTGFAVFQDYGDIMLRQLQTDSIMTTPRRGQQATKEAIAVRLVEPLRQIVELRSEQLRLFLQKNPLPKA